MAFGLQSHYRPKNTQTVAVGTTSAEIGTPIGDGFGVIRIVADTDCHYKIGVPGSVTATTSDAYLPANTVEYLSIHRGESIAFIQNAAAGTAYVTEVSQ